MRFSDLLQFGSRVWIKPEWGPITDRWPAITFTHEPTARGLSEKFRMDRDFMISVGTKNAEEVEERHRSRLLSVSTFPSSFTRTQYIVPKDVWEASQRRYPGQWQHAFAVKKLWQFQEPFPSAYDFVPEAYTQFSKQRSVPIELDAAAIASLADLDIVETPLSPTRKTVQTIGRQTFKQSPAALKHELSRLANLIASRVARSGEEETVIRPVREIPNDVDMATVLAVIWEMQNGICPLCRGAVPIQTDNSLLQMSADRIDSQNIRYDIDTVQITHLGCNYAKNKFSAEDFEEWLVIVAGNSKREDSVDKVA